MAKSDIRTELYTQTDKKWTTELRITDLIRNKVTVDLFYVTYTAEHAYWLAPYYGSSNHTRLQTQLPRVDHSATALGPLRYNPGITQWTTPIHNRRHMTTTGSASGVIDVLALYKLEYYYYYYSLGMTSRG